jgi:hypothetical protein
MPYQTTAFICEHCNRKMYRDLSTTKAHEKKCLWNPEHRACASCGNQSDRRTCSVTGENLAAKGALRRDCEDWAPKPADFF